jgi:hypothetical protein
MFSFVPFSDSLFAEPSGSFDGIDSQTGRDARQGAGRRQNIIFVARTYHNALEFTKNVSVVAQPEGECRRIGSGIGINIR